MSLTTQLIQITNDSIEWLIYFVRIEEIALKTDICKVNTLQSFLLWFVSIEYQYKCPINISIRVSSTILLRSSISHNLVTKNSKKGMFDGVEVNSLLCQSSTMWGGWGPNQNQSYWKSSSHITWKCYYNVCRSLFHELWRIRNGIGLWWVTTWNGFSKTQCTEYLKKVFRFRTFWYKAIIRLLHSCLKSPESLKGNSIF